MENDDWDDDEELLIHLLELIYNLQGFVRSEGYTQADYELYVSNLPTPTIH